MTAKEMGYEVGDVVTVTINPTITITQYDRFKPFASVSRTVRSLNEDMDALRATAVRQCMLNLRSELRLAKQLDGLSQDAMSKRVKKLLEKGVTNAEAEYCKDGGGKQNGGGGGGKKVRG